MSQESQENPSFSQLALHERLCKALDKLGFQAATAVQQAIIPPALAGADIQASAETGSGKTAAFVLPMLQRFLERPAPDTATRGLILLPTRELAAQILDQMEALAAFTPIRAALLRGGGSFREQQALIRKNPEIIIGTPGRVREHVEKKSLDLGDLEVLVLDEADRMLDMGLREEVLAIVAACRRERQTLLLSATLSHTGIGRIAGEVLRQPRVIQLGSHREQPHASIRQQAILADDPGHKRQLLTWLLGHEDRGKALIFANTRARVEELAVYLRHYHRAAALHGEMSQEERQEVMRRFRAGQLSVLVATDLAARGLDIKGIGLVVNHDLARSGDEHVHRIGRTGRAGASGLSIALIAPQEWNRLGSIERYLGLSMERREVVELPARFKGPAKKKPGNRKTAGKDKAPGKVKGKKAAPKASQRHRNQKNIGKRRQPTGAAPTGDEGGFSPLKRKK